LGDLLIPGNGLRGLLASPKSWRFLQLSSESIRFGFAGVFSGNPSFELFFYLGRIDLPPRLRLLKGFSSGF